MNIFSLQTNDAIYPSFEPVHRQKQKLIHLIKQQIEFYNSTLYHLNTD